MLRQAGSSSYAKPRPFEWSSVADITKSPRGRRYSNVLMEAHPSPGLSRLSGGSTEQVGKLPCIGDRLVSEAVVYARLSGVLTRGNAGRHGASGNIYIRTSIRPADRGRQRQRRLR